MTLFFRKKNLYNKMYCIVDKIYTIRTYIAFPYGD